MPSLEEAYSTELSEIINAETAYDLYWAGVIKDKGAFICPGRDCGRKMTCVNLDKLLQDMKVAVHFRAPQGHSQSCDVVGQDSRGLGLSADDGGHHAAKNKDPLLPDILRFNRPSSHFQGAKGESRPPLTKGLKRCTSSTHSRNGGQTEYHSVRALVSKWLRHKQENTDNDRYVSVAGQNLSYARLFRGVYKQDVSRLSECNRIYWGVAFVDRTLRDDAYRITFWRELEHEGVKIRPTIVLTDEQIEAYVVKKLVIGRLRKICGLEKPKGVVFVYSRPSVYETGSRTYINFKPDTIDALEVRGIEILDEIRSAKARR